MCVCIFDDWAAVVLNSPNKFNFFFFFSVWVPIFITYEQKGLTSSSDPKIFIFLKRKS